MGQIFSDYIFPKIDEKPYAVLYSGKDSDEMAQIMKIDLSLKRMDSLMVASNIKKNIFNFQGS